MELALQIHAGTFKVGVQIKEASMHMHLLANASTYPVPFPTIIGSVLLALVQATQSLVTLSI
jgi:hypothetical protein